MSLSPHLSRAGRCIPAVLSVILLLAAPGCGPRSGDGQVPFGRMRRIEANECIINIGSDPSSLDSGQSTDIPAARTILMLQRGLTVLNDESRQQPELAESWQVSDDGLTYTFKLRPARWTNGDPVTADDFVYAWTCRVLNPEFASQYAYQLFYLRGARAYYSNPELGPESVGVRALAPDVLEVQLEAPTPFFLELVAHHTYFPVNPRVDQANPDWHRYAASYVGCGPFVLKEYRPSDRIVLERNPDYWNADAVRMQRVILRMIEQESTERIAFENGEIDATQTVPQQDIASLRDRPYFRHSDQLATYYLYVNTQKPALADPRVRRALALAINRRELIDYVTLAGQEPALTLSPPSLYHGGLPDTPLHDAAFDEARALLAEAGYPGGRGLPPLTYLYNTMEGHRKIAVVLQETWRRELGVNLVLENQEFKVTIDRRRAGDYDIARAGWVADFKDPINFLEMFDSKSENNDSKWFDEHYDAMLAAARAEVDADRRMQLLREAELYLLENAPMIPIYFYVQNYLCAPELQGYVLNETGMFDPARLAWSKPAEE